MRNPAANIVAVLRAATHPTAIAAVQMARRSVAPAALVLAKHRGLLAGFRAIEHTTAGARAAAGLTPVIAASANRRDTTNAS